MTDPGKNGSPDCPLFELLEPRLLLGAGPVLEAAGDMDLTSLSWQARAPLGSMVYDTSVSAEIGSPGETDGYRVLVDRGQRITVVVEPDQNLQPTVGICEAFGANDRPGKQLADNSADAAGMPVILNSIATKGRLGEPGQPDHKPEWYSIIVGGQADTTGVYDLKIILNAAVEHEAPEWPSNDESAQAEDLDPAFLTLRHQVGQEKKHDDPQRAAVLGSLGDPPADEYRAGQTQSGKVYYPFTLTYNFAGALPPTRDGTLTVSARADLSSGSEYLTLKAEGIHLGDLFRTGGSDTKTVTTVVDLPQELLETLTADGTVTFTVKPSRPVDNRGSNRCSLTLSYPLLDEDWYSFSLGAGESATLALTSLSGGDVNIELHDHATALLALGIPIGTNVDEVIQNFISPAGGTYYARITGTGDYSLLVTRNVEFDIEPNDDFASAQPLLSPTVDGRQWIMGHVGDEGSQDPADLYSVVSEDKGQWDARTTVPAEKSGQFLNDLDPALRIYDSSGQLVGSDDNSAHGRQDPDAKLKHHVREGEEGVYYLEVAPSDASGEPTSGEYILTVMSKGGSQALPAFMVTDTDPADGSWLRASPAEITVNFNDALLLGTLASSDLLIDGDSAVVSGVHAEDGNTVVFTLSGALAEGWHTISIPAAALMDIQGTPIEAYTGQFLLDTIAPRVIFSSLQAGDVWLGADSLTYVAQFSETLDQTNLDDADFSLVGASTGAHLPDSWNYDAAGSTLTINYSSLANDSYTLTLLSGDGQFEDLIGWNLNGETPSWPIPPNVSGQGGEGGNFVVNFELVPLTAVDPLGSLIYDASISSSITSGVPTRRALVDLDPGQTVSALVHPASGLQPNIELYDPTSTLIGSASAPQAGKYAILQTAPATTPGTYVLVFSGGGGTKGGYTARVVLNAAVEEEGHEGLTNNNLGSAEDIDGSFITLAGGAERAAVVAGDRDHYLSSKTIYGKLYKGQLMYFYFTGALPPVGGGTLTVTAQGSLLGPSKYIGLGIKHVSLGDLFVKGGKTNKPVTTSLSLSYTTLARYAGDGTIWFRALASNEVTNQPGNFLSLTLTYPVAGEDWYSFNLDAGQSATLAVTSPGGSAGVELYDQTATLLAVGTPVASNVDEVIENFIAPVAGTYYARVAPGAGNYSLVVTRGATFDVEVNALATPQDLTIAGAAFGAIADGLDDDYYSIEVVAGDSLTISTSTPADGPYEFVNLLDPAIELYDPNGILVATDHDSAPDGQNATINYTAVLTGDYLIRVLADEGQGEYVLDAGGYTG